MQYVPDKKLLTDNNIIVPEKDWYRGGINDRFMISTPNVAFYYGTLYDQLLEYSKSTQIISEKYLYDQLHKKNITIMSEKIEYNTTRIKKDT